MPKDMDLAGRCIGYELTNSDQLMVKYNSGLKRRVGENIIDFDADKVHIIVFFYCICI
jgi:hypothetical protein